MRNCAGCTAISLASKDSKRRDCAPSARAIAWGEGGGGGGWEPEDTFASALFNATEWATESFWYRVSYFLVKTRICTHFPRSPPRQRRKHAHGREERLARNENRTHATACAARCTVNILQKRPTSVRRRAETKPAPLPGRAHSARSTASARGSCRRAPCRTAARAAKRAKSRVGGGWRITLARAAHSALCAPPQAHPRQRRACLLACVPRALSTCEYPPVSTWQRFVIALLCAAVSSHSSQLARSEWHEARRVSGTLYRRSRHRKSGMRHAHDTVPCSAVWSSASLQRRRVRGRESTSTLPARTRRGDRVVWMHENATYSIGPSRQSRLKTSSS